MVRRRFVLPGLTLRVTDDGIEEQRCSLPPLDAFETFDDGAVDHDVTIRTVGAAALVLRGAMVWSGTLIDGTYAEIGRNGSSLQFLVPGRVSIVEQPGCAVTLVDIAGEVERPLAGMAVMVLIDMAIRGHGLLMVHVATLLSRDGHGLILLFAPSGSGKTTTSLALALGGYGHLGDDVAVLRRSGASWLAWGLPRDLKVHRRTASMLPALGPLLGPYDAEDEARLTPAALATIVPMPTVAEYPVTAAILVGKRTESAARLISIPKSDALSEILADNVGMFDDGVPEHAKALFGGLARLVATTPVYRLDAGSDSGSIVPAFDAILGKRGATD